MTTINTLSCYCARRPIMPVKWVVYCVVLRDSSIGLTAVQWDSHRESRPLAQSFNKEPQLLLTNGAHRILTSPLAASPLPRAVFRPLVPLKAHYTSSQRLLQKPFLWSNQRHGGVETTVCQSNQQLFKSVLRCNNPEKIRIICSFSPICCWRCIWAHLMRCMWIKCFSLTL